ncbi:MEDS domain-containing protein [Raineyella sp.]|uniref:PucR C-terminal helix-turn-helix domain-containing protein n=1 Tax=bioreactor metagenome TaxID=1076179 RepID=A0A644XEV7_9ZZZZ|nr:MEDS domain-containing protein [Raineyella sp.]MEA5154098.1 MEDS domain-containing protein [Raineyella sp.]
MADRELGRTGPDIVPGDHVCGFYYGEQERDALLQSYLRTGLGGGDKCLAVLDATSPAQVATLIGDDVDVEACLRSRQLEIWGCADTYLRTGEFSAASMIDFWEQSCRTITDAGTYGSTRLVGEMSWLDRVAPPREAVVAYETWADGFAAQHSHSILCLYDLSRVGVGLMVDLLRTHPRIALNGMVMENPHFLTGDEFAAREVTTKTSDARRPDPELRDQLSELRGLLALSMVMTARQREDEIVSLAMTAAPLLGRCRLEGVYVDEDSGPPGHGLPVGIRRQLPGGDRGAPLSPVPPPRTAGTMALPLHGAEGVIGHMVITADEEPSAAELLMARTLAQQTGAALANARLHRRRQAATDDLRATVAQLARTVGELEHRNAIHDRFTRVATGDEGQQGIVEALSDLTGLAAAVEDRHGNLVAWAGGEQPPSDALTSAAERADLFGRAPTKARPIRVDGRLLAVARPRADVLGVLVLLDPDRTAGEPEIMALEHGATVLAMELARQRSVADTELRLGRDVVADLVGGDPEAGSARARALGYDLDRPHRVVIIEQPGPSDADELLTAVREAARSLGASLTPGASLMYLPRAGTVVLLVAGSVRGGGDRWSDFRAAVQRELGSRCLIGVGSVCRRPADFARSHHQAELCTRMVRTTGGSDGIAVYEDLGIYQLLSEVTDADAVPRFIRQWLGALLDYDTHHRASLVLTLSQFLETGGSYDSAATAMSIGRSTLRYRLQRIRQVSGHDLADPDTRFNLQLATRAWQTLRLNAAGPRQTATKTVSP